MMTNIKNYTVSFYVTITANTDAEAEVIASNIKLEVIKKEYEEMIAWESINCEINEEIDEM